MEDSGYFTYGHHIICEIAICYVIYPHKRGLHLPANYERVTSEPRENEKEKGMKKKICILGIITTLVVVMASLGACSKVATPKSQVTTKTSTTTSSTTSKTTATTSATTPTSNSDIFSLAQNITAMKYSTVESLPTGKTTGTVYEKKDKMRMEANVNGVSEINFTDFTTQTSYTYTPVQNTAYLTSGVTPSMLVTSKTGLIKSLNPQMIGTETIDGIVCQIYETTNSGDTAKIWFWKDKGLPIKIVMTDSGGTDTIEYKNYDFSDIPDSMFVLPAGVTMVQAPGS
jgi:hypothetical protein